MVEGVIVSELTHHEMVGTYTKLMKEKIEKRKRFYDSLTDVDNDPMTATPFEIKQLDNYKVGTELLEASLKLFKQVFEVK